MATYIYIYIYIYLHDLTIKYIPLLSSRQQTRLCRHRNNMKQSALLLLCRAGAYVLGKWATRSVLEDLRAPLRQPVPGREMGAKAVQEWGLPSANLVAPA
jgi:hypothetical protein